MTRAMIIMGTLFTALLPLLIDSTLKGAGLFLAAGVTVLILGKASASTRHLVWLFALGAVLALPILSGLLPHLAVLPHPNTAVAKSDASLKPQKPLEAHSQHAAIDKTEALSSYGVDDLMPGESNRLLHVQDWLSLGWTIGIALLVMRLAAAQWCLARAEKRCIAVRDGLLEKAKEQARQQLNIRRPVQLLLDSRRTIPMAWGAFRPRVLLPAEAADWDEARLRAVLLHEMAHIKRGDAVARWLAQLTCALHWFNPLVWFAAWRLRVESERACDDLVVTNGVRASDYANHLLHVATTLSPRRMTQACGLAMACPTGLEGRLLAVLNRRANRGRVTRTGAFTALALGLCVVIPLAMLRAAPDNEKRTNEAPSVTAVAAETNSLLPGMSTAIPSPLQPANAGSNEVNRVKLRHAESKLRRATELREQNVISESEFNKAKSEVEIARAEIAGRPDEVARIRLRDAVAKVDRLEELQKVNLVSKGEVGQAEYEVALLRAEMSGDAAETARVQFRQADAEFKRASQLFDQSLISDAAYNEAKEQFELSQAELQQSAIKTPPTSASTDEMQTLLKARDQARAKAEEVELKLREAGKSDGTQVFNAARAERDRHLATAREQAEQLNIYEDYAREAEARERQILRDIDVGSQSPAIAEIAHYETVLAQTDLLKARTRMVIAQIDLQARSRKPGTAVTATPATGQILVEARVIEAPAKEPIPDDPSNLTSGKGINVLSSPRILTGIGEEAEIFIGNEQPMNAGSSATESVRTGITLRVTPKLEDNRIAYTARLTLSDLVHSEAKGTQTVNETASHELHVSGTTKDGEGTWFHFTQYRNDKKTGVRAVWLKFTRQQ